MEDQSFAEGKLKFRRHINKSGHKGKLKRRFKSREELAGYMSQLGKRGGAQHRANSKITGSLSRAGRKGGGTTRETYGQAYYRAIRNHGKEWKQFIHLYDEE